ncbi:hypothetical protein CsSME_00018051 [Camellia sinensis var. sinensis]
MERPNSMSRGKQNLEGGDDDQPWRKRLALVSFVAIIEVVNDGGIGGKFLLACNNEEENGRCHVCGLIVVGDDVVVVNDKVDIFKEELP